MDPREIARLRLRSQRIAGGHVQTPEDVVGWLGAVQSQEYELAKWSIGQRGERLNDALVQAAIQGGSILRTHILRPTWHFVLPADIRWMMHLTAPRVDLQNRLISQRLELDDHQLRRSQELIVAALEGGRQLTSRQIGDVLKRGGISPAGLRLNYVLIRAERDLIVCSGGLEGKRRTYALLAERAPATPGGAPDAFDRDEALAELTRRYFTSHGPAAIGDLTWWSSLTTADAKRGLEMVGPSLERLEADGVSYWLSPERIGRDDPSPTIHLLQGFDELLVGYQKTRSAIDAGGHGPRHSLGAPPYLHAVILDGQLIGFWRRVATRDGFEIDTRLFIELDRAQHAALEEAIGRYARFIGAPFRLG
jgi:hypothetical protein